MSACFVIERAKIVIGLSFFVVKEVVSVSDMVNFDRQYRLAAGPAGGKVDEQFAQRGNIKHH